MVCLQSNPPFRPTHPALPHGIPGTDSCSSHDPGLAPQPSHGTTSAPAKQQALKTKMDIWWDTLKADSHIACRANAVPLSCRAAKGLECVFPIWFTQCGRVWFTLAMPRPCHAMTMPFSQGHGTARPSRDGLWATCPRSASSGNHAEFHEDCYQKPPHNDPYLRLQRVVSAHYKKKDDLLNCWASSSDISGYHADFHEGHGTVGAGQGKGMGCVN